MAVQTTAEILKILEFQAPVKVMNPAAFVMGKLGDSKGGEARAPKLVPDVRKAIAQHAAKARRATRKAE